MVCPNCGCECDENSMFCTKCGTKINTFENDIAPSSVDKTYDDTFTGITIEAGKDEISQLDDETFNNSSASDILNDIDDDIDDLDDFDDSYIASSKHNYKSVQDSYLENKSSYNKKKLSKKNVLVIALITVLLIIISVFSTLAVKKTVMTNKFDKYYANGNNFFDEENYEYAKSQYILASSNAFTKEQKIKAYEKVYEVDGLLKNYESEQIHYLELLIEVDKNNVKYYKDLIVLYQNNDMNSKIKSLIASAPKDLQEELEQFKGTVPTANVEDGTYDKPIEVKLDAGENVKIYYTLDGSNPTDSTTKKEYTEPITLSTEGVYVVRAYSEDENKNQSKDSTFKYILEFKTIDPPKVEPKSGEYEEQEKIVVTAPEGCKIYYTKDGSTPTKKDMEYTKPIKMPKENSLYYFVAIDEEGISSRVVTRAYNYAPNKVSYDQALDKLTDYLMSTGVFENEYGDFANGDVGYLRYKETKEIDSIDYYIISCEIEDKNGNNVSSKSYSISCSTGSIKSESSYSDDDE